MKTYKEISEELPVNIEELAAASKEAEQLREHQIHLQDKVTCFFVTRSDRNSESVIHELTYFIKL